VQEMRTTHDRNERSHSRDRGVRFFYGCRCIQFAGCKGLRMEP